MPITHLSRRGVVQGGAIVVGFSLAGIRPLAAADAGAPSKPVALDQVDSFLALQGDGSAIVYSGKVDLGTGIHTALTQMAAEELDLPLARVTVIQGDTALTPDQGVTSGSLSIQNGGTQIRAAAATARRKLVELASERLGTAPGALVTENGRVKPASGGEGIA